jgi:hypothetical protein
MINDMDAIHDLVDHAPQVPIQSIVTTDDFVDLVTLLNDGAHAFISDRLSVGPDRWMITMQTRSKEKWNRLRAWRGGQER